MTRNSRPPNGRASKDKGYAFEVHVKDLIRTIDPEAARNGTLYGPADRGDIDSPLLDLVIQAKNTKAISLLNVADAASAQARNAGRADWIVVHRYRRGDSYAPHERNLWTVEEAFARRLLALYGLSQSGVMVLAPRGRDLTEAERELAAARS
ncbi:hypothetical protein [Glycomyces buryatensis]|uniref:Uncharacterized protein n=1 Tax=Glycomyces buryatensis TaxID=2570927 RepID=A0A4S8Q5T2_9ACTN|nr:hypothetical protein [Glycomyces buryatensis]THV39667.1 hypothetical protein FAB82_17515 [Glycomyces buryatensis]